MKVLTICLIFLISTNCLAEDSVPLKKDQPAPFDGLLLSQDKAQEVKNSLVEKNALGKLNESLNVSLKIQEDIISRQQNKVQILLDQNDKLAKTAYDSQSVNDWVKIMWFGAGILTTGLVFYGLGQANR